MRSFWLAIALAGAACGAPQEPAGPVDLTGSWRVRGVTTEVSSGSTRDIEGMLVVVHRDDHYTASFHLTTLYPTPEGPMPAEVVGNGEGVVEGRKLSGSAEIQLIMAMIPGEAGRFPLAPRRYGPRLKSRSSGSVQPDGSLIFDSENSGVRSEGDDQTPRYPPTRTRLHGSRIAAR